MKRLIMLLTSVIVALSSMGQNNNDDDMIKPSDNAVIEEWYPSGRFEYYDGIKETMVCKFGESSSTKFLVAFEGNDVYISGFNRFDYDNDGKPYWIVGTLDGKYITFQSSQLVSKWDYNEPSTEVVGYNKDTKEYDVPFTMEYEEESHTIKMIDPYQIRVIYERGYDHYLSFTLSEEDQSIPPKDAIIEDYNYHGKFTYPSDAFSFDWAKAQVVFHGNNIYIKGLLCRDAFVTGENMPDDWLVGTKNGDAYVFENGQFVGATDYYNKEVYFTGASMEGSSWNVNEFSLSYDPETEILTGNNMIGAVRNMNRTDWDNVYELISNVVLTKDPNNIIEIAPEDNNSPSYDLQGRRLKGKPSRGIYVKDGKKVVVR